MRYKELHILSLIFYVPCWIGLYYTGHYVWATMILVAWLQLLIITLISKTPCNHEAVPIIVYEEGVFYRHSCAKCKTGLGVPILNDFYERFPPPPIKDDK